MIGRKSDLYWFSVTESIEQEDVMNRCFHYVHNRSLKGVLDPLLKKWTEIVLEYCKLFKYEEAPYVYGERANISIFAGAIWRLNGMAMSEYPEKKVGGGSGHRADFWFFLNGEHFVIEAKNRWLSIGSRSSTEFIRNGVEAKLKEAVEEVNKHTTRHHSRAGLAFIVPTVGPSEIEIVDERIELIVSELKKVQADAMAYVFPDSIKPPRGKRHSVGQAVLLRLA